MVLVLLAGGVDRWVLPLSRSRLQGQQAEGGVQLQLSIHIHERALQQSVKAVVFDLISGEGVVHVSLSRRRRRN